ncbi:hypothetical protein B0H13DRAFT_2452315 [Mycena leptocephala]|nr:hypothetical protein B0H13DRAFT_2452315 [Mycena leptocephala]
MSRLSEFKTLLASYHHHLPYSVPALFPTRDTRLSSFTPRASKRPFYGLLDGTNHPQLKTMASTSTTTAFLAASRGIFVLCANPSVFFSTLTVAFLVSLLRRLITSSDETLEEVFTRFNVLTSSPSTNPRRLTLIGLLFVCTISHFQYHKVVSPCLEGLLGAALGAKSRVGQVLSTSIICSRHFRPWNSYMHLMSVRLERAFFELAGLVDALRATGGCRDGAKYESGRDL